MTKAGGGGGEDVAMARGSIMVQTNRGAWCEGAEGEFSTRLRLFSDSMLKFHSSGLFPVSMCWQPDPRHYSLTGAQETRLGRAVEKFAQVKQSLSAQLEDELDLRLGQIVKITHVIDKDWYR